MPSRLVSPVIVGREAELERVTEALDGAVEASPIHLVIAGEAGVGKSRLVAEVAERARARGLRVLRGGCASVGEGGLPYGPIVEVLGDLARSLDPDTLRAVLGPAAADLARLVPSLDPTAAAAPAQREWLQTRLLDALLDALRRLAALGPVVLIVEDVHWADAATRDALAYLVRSTRPDRLLLAVTLRSDELHRRHPALPWLAELERTGRTERIDLPRLGLGETAELLEAIRGQRPDPDLVARIHRRSDGNPFFVEELLAAEDAAGSQVPTTLHGILLARLAAVPEPAQGILGIVAVAGRRIDHDLLAEVAAIPEPELLASLRDAVTSGILLADADATGREGYAFRHALLAEVTYDELLPGERRRLHRACAEALAERPTAAGAPAAAHWTELAHHWGLAHQDDRAFDASLRAADEAQQAFAFEAALHGFEHALELWPGVTDAEGIAGRDRVDVLNQAAHAAYLAGIPHRAVALQRDAVAGVDLAADPERAALLRGKLGRLLWMSGDATGALAANEAALALLPLEPPSAARAQVLSSYGQLLMLLDRVAESTSICEEAVRIAAEVGALEVEGHALGTLGPDQVARGHVEEGLATLEASLRIAAEISSVDDIGRGYVNLVSSLVYSGQLERAVAAGDEGMRIAGAIGVGGTYGAFVGHNIVTAEYERGRWDRAAALADELEIDGAPPPTGRYGLAHWIPLVVGRGELERAARLLADLWEHLEGRPVEGQFHGAYRASEAELALWEGRPDHALAAVEQAFRELANAEWTFYHAKLYRLGARAAADLAETARARRDGDAERQALERAAALRVAREAWVAGRLAVQAEIQAGETRAEAATAAAEDRRLAGEADPAAWADAVARWRDRGRPYLLAYTRWREAEALLAGGDRATATEAMREAARIADDLGARPLAAAIAELARRARLDIGGAPAPEPAPVVATPADPYGLTRREREVLGLVALGRTNRQIADELFISENTAGVHVSNILGKLGVAGRTEAAAIAVRAGYAAPGD